MVAIQVSVVGYRYRGLCLLLIPIALHEPGHTRGGSTGTRSEQLCRSTRDLHLDRGDPSIRTQEEHEDQGSGAQQPSETVLEHTSGGDQDSGDVHDSSRSGNSKGKPWRSSYAVVHTDH